jgi:4-hydroxy-3-polyprenylbenzoate decarboxylase
MPDEPSTGGGEPPSTPVPVTRRVVIGVSGASGAPYAERMMRFFAGPGRAAGIEAHVVFSKFGRLNWADEVGTDPASYGLPLYNPGDMTVPFASGSARFDAMCVVPCSAGQVGRIATGVSADLIGRAADVFLKERRPLVLVVRETPYSLILLRNMATLTEAGATVMSAAPSFYSQPKTIEALLDTVVARALDRMGIDNSLMKRWAGRDPSAGGPA